MIRSMGAFIGAAVRHPVRVGAIAPSSRWLAGRLASVVPTGAPATAVELGPGTGVVSAAIRARLAPGSRQLAVELDPGMRAHLARHRPWLDVVAGDARDVVALAADRGIARADAVVSGLPWALFDAKVQREVLADVAALLDGQGTFTTFAYLHALPLPAARAFRSALEDVFEHVEVSAPVWRNLPPALCYVCR